MTVEAHIAHASSHVHASSQLHAGHALMDPCIVRGAGKTVEVPYKGPVSAIVLDLLGGG